MARGLEAVARIEVGKEKAPDGKEEEKDFLAVGARAEEKEKDMEKEGRAKAVAKAVEDCTSSTSGAVLVAATPGCRTGDGAADGATTQVYVRSAA